MHDAARRTTRWMAGICSIMVESICFMLFPNNMILMMIELTMKDDPVILKQNLAQSSNDPGTIHYVLAPT
jgi:hypothetical protein